MTYGKMLASLYGLRARVAVNIERRMPGADEDLRAYLAEIEYCKAVVALEVFNGGDFDYQFTKLRDQAARAAKQS